MSQVLEVSLPILEGRFAGKLWIKYVLKEITRANGLAQKNLPKKT